jgi:predicted nuclease of restriction endonuclease-like (RecB) superfamily
MTDSMPPTTYAAWITELKAKFRRIQIKAAVTVNRELLTFYWDLGAEIIKRQAESNWGERFIPQLSHDLIVEFPEIKGFSPRNLALVRKWRRFWEPHLAIAKQLVSQLTELPWGHHIAIISKCENVEEALYYVQSTITLNWSRSVLVHQIESGLYRREGKAVSNFTATLPAPQSDLANQTLKNPYVFDFLSMSKDFTERELEKGLVQHITHFLLELGSGFAYIGRQIPLTVGEREFFIDLLFYHTRLHCHIVIELKTTDFEPEHAGKLNFYIKAVDEQIRQEGDQPTIGIVICKKRDKLVAEYALSDIHKPIGISEYQLTQSLPENLKSSLPSIEEIEAEFGGESGKGYGETQK